MADAAKPKSVEELSAKTRSAANWCFWIAGFTAINAAMIFRGSETGFVLGSVIAQTAMAVAATKSTAAQGIALAFNGAVVGCFVLLGVFGRKGHRWAFVLAFLAYMADTLLQLLDPTFIAMAFHLWVLVVFAMGLLTATGWRKARAAAAEGTTLTVQEALTPAGPVTSPEKLDGYAQEMEEMVQRIYATKHERRVANPKDFNVDHGFYDRMLRELEALKFRHLGDYEIADLKGTPQDTGCFLRVAASEDGMASACVYHYQPPKWWLRLILRFMTRGTGLKCTEFQTEFSNGHFVVTGNIPLAGTAKLPPQIESLHLPAKTKLVDLHARHIERVAAFLDRHRTATVRMVRTLADAHAAEDRQDALKATHRRDIGGMTREEIFAHADSPAKLAAAEQLWSRIEERKAERATTPESRAGK